MKQKLFFLVIAVFLLNEGIYAQIKSQKVSITWGEEIKASRKATLDGIIGFDQTGIYCTRREAGGMFSRSSTYTVEHYDNNMKQTKSVELKLKEGNKDKELEQIIYLKNKIYLFSSFRDKSEKMNFLYMQTLNKNNLNPNNDITEVAEIDYEDFSRYNSGYYGNKITRDSNKILVYNNLPYDKGENEKLSFNVY
ncbi:MAG: hypothetical protein PHD97_07745, partial [Bacteroidales bacterium]|nr:hypothetical protein [Bacteroidales bacterium]